MDEEPLHGGLQNRRNFCVFQVNRSVFPLKILFGDGVIKYVCMYESEASTKHELRARGGVQKNPICLHTIVEAVPAFKYERGYPIGYFTSRDP